MARHYWLMKSEPSEFSIDDLRRVGIAAWDGVRNYQARNYMRVMHKGDLAFFYHSSVQPSTIAGMIEIVKEAYPDPTQFDPKNVHYDPVSGRSAPRWDQVDVNPAPHRGGSARAGHRTPSWPRRSDLAFLPSPRGGASSGGAG